MDFMVSTLEHMSHGINKASRRNLGIFIFIVIASLLGIGIYIRGLVAQHRNVNLNQGVIKNITRALDKIDNKIQNKHFKQILYKTKRKLHQDLPLLFILFFFIAAHALCSVLFFFLLCDLTQPIVALWGALYFGLHPTVLEWLPNLTHGWQVILTLTLLLLLYESLITFKKNGRLPIFIFFLLAIRATPGFLGFSFLIPLLLIFFFFYKSIFAHLRKTQKVMTFIGFGGTTLIAGVRALEFFAQSPTLNLNIHRLLQVLFDVFGLTWLPSNLPVLRIGALLFWLITIISLWLKSDHKKLLTLISLSLAATSLPALFLPHYEGYFYQSIALYITLLIVLYEFYPHENTKRYIRALLLPLFGALIFTSGWLTYSLIF